MRTYLADIIPKIKKFSQKLDNNTLLTNQHWVVLDEIDHTKNVFIFKSNLELIVSQDGKVERGSWEYLGNNTLTIKTGDEEFLFKHGFLDENVLALKVDGGNEYALFVNESKFDSNELNSVERINSFFDRKYLSSPPPAPKEESELSPAVIIFSILLFILCCFMLFGKG